MLLLPIFLAAKALAATTYTVTVLDDNPDARTLSTPASTAPGDVVTYLTLYPNGVDSNGQTQYARQTGVPAGTTVTSLLDIPSATSPTASPAGTLTQSLPWHDGHHIEVLTVTDPDGTVHEVTRIDQQSTHVTVSQTTKPNGDVVLVSSGLYPTGTDTATPTSTTTVTTLAPAPTQEKRLSHVRALPFCDNGNVSWSTIDPGCWRFYDMIVPTPPPINNTTPAKCTGNKHRTVAFTIASIPMKGANPTDSATSPKKKETSLSDLRDAVKDSFKGRNDNCEVVQDFIDFGECGGVRVVQATGPEALRLKAKRKPWILRCWWVAVIPILLIALLLLPCVLCFKRHQRRNAAAAEKPIKQEAVTVVQQPVPVVVANGAGGAAGSSAGSTAGGAAPVAGAAGSGGAGGTGSTTSGTTGPAATATPAPAGAAPATTTTTAVPAEVVTTTTETNNDHAGTMRRAAEEGRAGHRVRFDGQAAENTPATAHQVDGTAELRTGSEVFDVGSMRGRKRNRGDEPL